MRKAYYILAYIFLQGANVFSQNITVYDFKTKQPPTITTSQIGSNSIFRIKNINKFLYNVKIETSQSEFNSTPPAIFSTIFNLEKTNKSNTEEIANNLIKSSLQTVSLQNLAIELGTQNSTLFSFKQELGVLNDKLSDLNLQSDSLKEDKLIDEQKRTIDKLSKTIEELENQIKDQESKIAELSKTLNDEFIKLTTDLYTKALIVNSEYGKLEEIKNIKKKLVRISLTDGLSEKMAAEKIKELSSDFPYIYKPELLLSSFFKSYLNFKTSLSLYQINTIITNHFNDEEKIINFTQPLFTEINNTKETVDNYNYAKLFEEIDQLITEIMNPTNYSVTSDPVQAKEDIIIYKVKISPRQGIESLNTLENRSFDIEIPIEGGTKLDFSTGLLITTGLHDRKYSKSVLISDTNQSKITVNENNNLAQFSLGALMHVSPRVSGNFKLGFTFGFGLNSTDITTAQLFIGASAMFGTNERFNVSLGLTLSRVDYLNSKYTLDTPIKNSEINTELTEKVIRPGLFIGLTYNLTNTKKE